MKRCYLSLPTLATVLLLWSGIAAQNGVILSGMVEDPTGAALTKTRLILINQATGEKLEVSPAVAAVSVLKTSRPASIPSRRQRKIMRRSSKRSLSVPDHWLRSRSR